MLAFLLAYGFSYLPSNQLVFHILPYLFQYSFIFCMSHEIRSLHLSLLGLVFLDGIILLLDT